MIKNVCGALNLADTVTFKLSDVRPQAPALVAPAIVAPLANAMPASVAPSQIVAPLAVPNTSSEHLAAVLSQASGLLQAHTSVPQMESAI